MTSSLRLKRTAIRAVALALVCTLLSITGCANRTRVRLNDGTVVQGRAVRDGTHLAIRSRSRDTPVEPCNVEDVSHSGTSAMIWGGVAAGVGALVVAASTASMIKNEPADGHVGVPDFMLLPLGGGMMAGGIALGAAGLHGRNHSKDQVGELQCARDVPSAPPRGKVRPRLRRPEAEPAEEILAPPTREEADGA